MILVATPTATATANKRKKKVFFFRPPYGGSARHSLA